MSGRVLWYSILRTLPQGVVLIWGSPSGFLPLSPLHLPKILFFKRRRKGRTSAINLICNANLGKEGEQKKKFFSPPFPLSSLLRGKNVRMALLHVQWQEKGGGEGLLSLCNEILRNLMQEETSRSVLFSSFLIF